MSIVLINLVPVATGGGLQNALSLLRQLARREDTQRFVVACRASSAIARTASSLGFRSVEVGNSPLARLRYDNGGAARIARRVGAGTVFTLFGPTPRGLRAVRTISGVAYSNLLHPEVDFWHFLPPHRRVLQWIKDRMRLAGARRADVAIFETPLLAERARDGLFADRRVEVVEMEPSALVLERLSAVSPRSPDGASRRILALAGPHPNKRLDRLAPVIAALNAGAGERYRLVATIEPSHRYARTLRAAFDAVGQGDALELVGAVAPETVATLIDGVDALVNVALLESFSNNWVEAWATGRLLVVTDASWARASCGEAAVYADVDDPEGAADRIREAMQAGNYARYVQRGRDRLAALAAQGSKAERYVAIIDEGTDR